MEKILIQSPNEYEASSGEKLELHFKILSLPLLSTIQKNMIINKINQDRHTKVESIESLNGELVVTVIITDNPFPIILLIGGVITILSGFFVWGSLDKVYKILETPQGKIAGISATIGFIAAGAALLILLFKK